MAKKEFIINLACTGAISTKAISAKIPLNHEEILIDIAECIDLGVQMFHIHARDDEGKQTSDPEPYGRLIEAIRKLPNGKEAIICVTTSGRSEPTFEFRARVLDLDGDMKPDMASLTLGSLNFMDSASINAPTTIRKLAQKMQEVGISPELEVFDLGMINFMKVLIREGLIDPPHYTNILLGNIAGAQATPIELGSLLTSLPDECFVSVGGLGRYQLSSNMLGLLFADGIRTGLEDNLWFDTERHHLATNSSLVRRIIHWATELERPLMSRLALRKYLRMDLTGSH